MTKASVIQKMKKFQTGCSRQIFNAVLGLALVTSLAGCSVLDFVKDKVASVASVAESALGLKEPGPPKWSMLRLVAEKGAFDDTAAAADLVCITDEKLSATFSKTAAKIWFDNKENLLATYAENLTLISREIVPQQTLLISEEELESCVGFTAHLFVNYRSDGLHALTLDMSTPGYTVELGKSQFKATVSE